MKLNREKPWKIYYLPSAVWLLIPFYSSRTSMNSKFAVGISACTSGAINRRPPKSHISVFIMIECWQSLRRMFLLSKWKVYYEYWNAIWVPDVHTGRKEGNEGYRSLWSGAHFTIHSLELPVCQIQGRRFPALESSPFEMKTVTALRRHVTVFSDDLLWMKHAIYLVLSFSFQRVGRIEVFLILLYNMSNWHFIDVGSSVIQ